MFFTFLYKKNTSRKTFLVECLRRGAASCKHLEKVVMLTRNSHTSVASDWSALDAIGRSPFLTSWNLHKVELFSAFISHLGPVYMEWGTPV